MDIANLTTTAAIRASIGASATDLPDTYICDSSVEAELQANLIAWLPSYLSILSDGESASATELQQLSLNHLRLYSQYYCADQINRTSNFALLQMTSDGENEVQRFQDNHWEQLTDAIKRKLAVHRKYLVAYAKSAYAGGSETNSYTLFGKATPDYDPVTGEST